VKRTPLKRKKGLVRGRPPSAGVEAQGPRARAVPRGRAPARKWCECKTPQRGHAHHVLYQQHAKAEGANPHDPRNAMLVCGHCHFQHHKGVWRIPESAIPVPALEFLIEVLGVDRARDYLARYYG
jgi:hypothetical protein